MRLLLGLTLVGLVAAPAAAAKAIESINFTLLNHFGEVTVVGSTGPLVQERVVLFADAQQPLVQSTIVLNRVYNPDTLRGVVSGEIHATGPSNHDGELHGVITPDGMSGTFSMLRTNPDAPTPLVHRVLGSWTSDGQPVDTGPSSTYVMEFDGHVVGPLGGG